MPSEVTTSTKREHLSFSQIQLASQCGEAYRRKYIEGHVNDVQNLPAMAGTAFHKAVEVWEGAFYHSEVPPTAARNNDEKWWADQVEWLTLMTKKQLNIVIDAYPHGVDGIITYGNQDLTFWRKEKLEGLAQTYLDYRLLEYQRGFKHFGDTPAEGLEVRAEAEIGGYPFLGMIDMLYYDSLGRLVIRDLKTGEAKSHHAMQVQQYRVALERGLGIKADYGQLLYVKRSKPYPQVVTWDLGDAEIDELSRRLRNNVEGQTLMVNGPFTGHCTVCDFKADCPWGDVTPHGSS